MIKLFLVAGRLFDRFKRKQELNMVQPSIAPELTRAAIKALPAFFNQAHRMVEFLSEHPHSPSGHVAHHCAIGNLSDVAHKANKFIYPLKLFIACERPPTPLRNRFNETSNQFLWSLYRLPEEAANDPIYHGVKPAA